MPTTSHSRGHLLIFIQGAGWCFADTMEPIIKDRSCMRCNRSPTKEGYDACLGYIPGAISACCGHGVEKPTLLLGRR